MKQYPQEQIYLKNYLKNISIPELSSTQQDLIREMITYLRKTKKTSPWFHNLMEFFPFFIIASCWYLLIYILPSYLNNKTVLFFMIFIFHGFLGYQWVIYGLHEGAGHGLFKNKKTFLHRILNFFAFHSARIMMADPEYYHATHLTHHKHTGTDKDEAQTNFVLIKRIFISLLPGAGILFPNNYRIHKGDEITKSQIISTIIGLSRFYLEYIALKSYFSLFEIIIMLFLLSPWVGLFLDRSRESLEHHLMPQSKIYGTRELGNSPLALIIAGGPWGQPYHFSHHFAPDLNWYQQHRVHKNLANILSEDQKDFFGFNSSVSKLIFHELKKHLKIEFTLQEELK
jgi:fatty acid desaturase